MAAARAELAASRVGVVAGRLLQRPVVRLVAAVRALLRRVVGPLEPATSAVGSAAQRTATAVRPGTPPILYRDGMVTLDGEGVVVSRYWWPWGRHRVPYAAIREVREVPLTGSRRYRVHGFSFPRHWLHHDRNRGQRPIALELRTGGLLWPLLTPVDATAVREVVRERTRAGDER